MTNAPLKTDPKQLRRSEMLINTYWWLASALAALMILTLVFSAVGIGNPLHESIRLPISVEIAEAVGDTGPTVKGNALVVIGHDSVLVHFGSRLGRFLHGLIVGLTLALGFFWIGLQLHRFLREVRAGRWFAESNPARVKSIGWIILIAGPVYGLAKFMLAWCYVDRISIPGAKLSLSFDLHLELALVGLVILMIGQMFEHGCRLQRDVDLTI